VEYEAIGLYDKLEEIPGISNPEELQWAAMADPSVQLLAGDNSPGVTRLDDGRILYRTGDGFLAFTAEGYAHIRSHIGELRFPK
jgi:hypothetical protein